MVNDGSDSDANDDCDTAEIGDRPAALDGPKLFALKACEGGRVKVGEMENAEAEAETEGDLKPMSLRSLLTAVTGVTGEAIDLEVAGLWVWSIVSAGEGTKVDSEERDLGLEDMEPC